MRVYSALIASRLPSCRLIVNSRLHHTTSTATTSSIHIDKYIGQSGYLQDINNRLRNNASHVRLPQDIIPDKSMFVFEYFTGHLLHLAQQDLSLQTRKRLLKEGLRAIAEMHDKDIVHTDIKPDNFFVNWKHSDDGITIGKVQLGDLEDAVYIPPGSCMRGKQAGNWMWRSPEAHARGKVNKSSDIFSFALVRVIFAVSDDELDEGIDRLAIVIERQISYFADKDGFHGFLECLDDNPWAAVFNITLNGFNQENPVRPFLLWKGVDDDFKSLICAMTNFDPRRRLTAREALAHKWFDAKLYVSRDLDLCTSRRPSQSVPNCSLLVSVMADSAYPYDTSIVRELLKNKRKSRGIRSCFPCRHRKVRCDGQVPCSSCVKRNHPELCRVPTSSETGNEDHPPSVAADVPQGPSQNYNSTNLENDTSSVNPGDATATLISRLEAIEEQIALLKADLLATAAATTTMPASQPSPLSDSVARLPGMRVRPASKSPGRYVVEDATGATIYLGRHADAPLALGCRQTTMSAMTGDLSLQDALINQCMPRAYPFINLWGADATVSDVCQTLPEDSDVIRYWQAYQTKAYPFYPALAAIDEFAQALFAFLDQRMLAHEATTPSEEPSSSWMALLFAVLACGVQFSDDPIQERDLRSKVLSRLTVVARKLYSNQGADCGQFARHFNVCAMALIGHCLRNNLDTNSAWILMGATIRLAQSIGLHETSPSLPEAEQFERSRLWWVLIWQDTFLSFTYDRPLGTIAMNCPIPYKHDTDGLGFQECVFAICHQIIDEARQKTTDGPQDPLESMRKSKRQLDGIRDAAALFLADKRRCVSLQDHLERLALGVHLGYVTCRIDRVYLDGHTGAPFPTAIAVDCVQRAMQAIESFLDLHRYSASVCRSWAFVHNAVSCAITLKSLNHVPVDERRKSDLLVQRLIAVLEKEEKDSEWCDDDTNVRYFGPYSRALKALREICHSTG
ncbi:hypothetical protein M752DRAFT_283201 [Aspergillus phoenicis ATCC 13157]|uniref:Zn(2)-C6 fungal-type domain-containing protein n=1 Tax=Aspergillus phoenicis ATCC 13157 TaxID=1353007 RepID=A0A370PMU9_ASPPH|nr:hypothetical protein M752DRAFT_283201 [Aspergillus phoenicis ATCC 13157]